MRTCFLCFLKVFVKKGTMGIHFLKLDPYQNGKETTL